MIGSISFLGQIPSIHNTNRTQVHKMSEKSDCFIKSHEDIDKLSQTIEKAKEKIKQILVEKNIEYGVIISPEGRLLQENSGDEKSCKFDSRKVVPNAILIHGHPEDLPLSSGDIAGLLATDAKVEEAVTKEGKFSRLIKKYPFRSQKSYSDLYYELEKKLNLMALDALGIDYKLNMDDVIKMGVDYLKQITGRSYDNADLEEILMQLNKFGIKTNGSLEEIFKSLKDAMFLQLITNPHKYDKEHNCIIEHTDAISNFLDTEEGIKIRHKLVQEVADEYNLIYETNLN